MPLHLARRDDRPALVPRLATTVAVAGMMLMPPSPAAAATVLQNPRATPASGTTETMFIFSVDYLTDSSWGATSVSVEVIGLGGSPLPMSLVAGTSVDGTWHSNPTMLPEGSWETVVTAGNEGPPPQQPAELAGPTVLVIAPPAPTPTPDEQTPLSTSSPTVPPSATATASPSTAAAPTPVPTPRPPGATPTATPPAPPASPSGPSPVSSERVGASSPRPSDTPSGRPSGSERAGPATSASPGAPEASPSGEGTNGGSGWGRAGWIVLGGLTSAAGAAVLARQWLVRRPIAGI